MCSVHVVDARGEWPDHLVVYQQTLTNKPTQNGPFDVVGQYLYWSFMAKMKREFLENDYSLTW